ncbi:MAG: UDP-3-O-(3-hydroxymyristoyl)glucosamine N-acyltransferase [Methylobacteriaceae bacterium]|jgi:UDP-3-O-[3-hydroxymyristoyl] glucosamine N-acyltransferase|nr:UDP-3-O-(3-hydroxymyristoyl)glucosamine N-acyltransferase [Methylobacteriaceae bacterium]
MHNSFFLKTGPLTLRRVIELAGGQLPNGRDPDALIANVAPLEYAGPDDIAYMDNPAYVEQLAATRAGYCLVSGRFADRVPATTLAIVTRRPYHVFAAVMALLYPSAMRPRPVFQNEGVSPGAFIHNTVEIGDRVTVDPGVVIGAGAVIGSGTTVAANSVVGPGCVVGQECSIGTNVTVNHCVMGDHVILHPGVRIGQDGFGFAMGPEGHQKVPQIGRVIIHNDVEIGANTTIDRGASRDTVIGDGTKIDNLVQIGHNVCIGKHCVIVACVGIAGSTTLEDFVVVGGGAGIAGHLRLGTGAQIAAYSGVNNDIPAGEKWGGAPAKPWRVWAKELALVKSLGAKGIKDRA